MNPFFNSKLRTKLYFDDRTNTIPKSNFENKVIDNVLVDEDKVNSDKTLLKGIYDLKKKGLLKNKRISRNLLPADSRIKYIYNDYHTKVTNPGYSRKWGGNGGLYFR